MGAAWKLLLSGAGMMSIIACAPTTNRGRLTSAGDRVTIAFGPCFGFCPVYHVDIAPGGGVTFTGERHTAALGTRQRRVAPSEYSSLLVQLAPFRPANGETKVIECTAAISDMSTYTITWTDGTGGAPATATNASGCPGGGGLAMTLTRFCALCRNDWASKRGRSRSLVQGKGEGRGDAPLHRSEIMGWRKVPSNEQTRRQGGKPTGPIWEAAERGKARPRSLNRRPLSWFRPALTKVPWLDLDPLGGLTGNDAGSQA